MCPYSKGIRGPALPLVLRRTDGAHRRVVYSGSRQSRLHLNLRIKNGERVSLRGAPKAPRIYRAAGAAARPEPIETECQFPQKRDRNGSLLGAQDWGRRFPMYGRTFDGGYYT